MRWTAARSIARRASTWGERFKRETRGVVALEFSLLVLPFLTLVFGVVSVGLYFFQVSSVESAAMQAARAIRTGQLQQSQGAYAGLTSDTQKKAAFLQSFCNAAPSLTGCTSKTVVIVQSSTSFAGITPPSCTSGGNLVDNNTTPFEAGNTSSVVLVTVCYPWSLLGQIALGKVGSLSDGSFLMQASVAFRTEPY